jgi:hypothetical protein
LFGENKRGLSFFYLLTNVVYRDERGRMSRTYLNIFSSQSYSMRRMPAIASEEPTQMVEANVTEEERSAASLRDGRGVEKHSCRCRGRAGGSRCL